MEESKGEVEEGKKKLGGTVENLCYQICGDSSKSLARSTTQSRLDWTTEEEGKSSLDLTTSCNKGEGVDLRARGGSYQLDDQEKAKGRCCSLVHLGVLLYYLEFFMVAILLDYERLKG